MSREEDVAAAWERIAVAVEKIAVTLDQMLDFEMTMLLADDEDDDPDAPPRLH